VKQTRGGLAMFSHVVRPELGKGIVLAFGH
jgi:hypothetical protein